MKKKTERNTNREPLSKRQREKEPSNHKKEEIYKDKQKLTDRQSDRLTNYSKHTYIQTDRETDRKVD